MKAVAPLIWGPARDKEAGDRPVDARERVAPAIVEASTTTDAAGRFRFAGLSAARCRLETDDDLGHRHELELPPGHGTTDWVIPVRQIAVALTPPHPTWLTLRTGGEDRTSLNLRPGGYREDSAHFLVPVDTTVELGWDGGARVVPASGCAPVALELPLPRMR